MKKIVFLDRDGVINQDSDAYIKTPDEFHFIPKSPQAIALLTQHGFDVILITNQSAIGRGMVTPKVLDAIFNKLKTGVKAAGGHITDIFFCPHTLHVPVLHNFQDQRSRPFLGEEMVLSCSRGHFSTPTMLGQRTIFRRCLAQGLL